MSDYGIRIRDKNNKIIYDTSSVAFHIVDTLVLPAGYSGSKSYSYLAADYRTLSAQLQFINNPPDDQEGYSPIITISGWTVSIAPQPNKASEACTVVVLTQ